MCLDHQPWENLNNWKDKGFIENELKLTQLDEQIPQLCNMSDLMNSLTG
jgi:hypothetical protein